MAADLIADDNPAYCGRPGLLGQRASNIIQQKADALYCFGARLDGDQTAYNYANFAPRATKHIYDVDVSELDKLPLEWEKNCGDLSMGIQAIESLPDTRWLSWCKALHARFDHYATNETEYVNPFNVAEWLSEIGRPDDVFAIGSSGQAPCTFLQAFRVKKGQRICNVSTFGAMGADIPMAIGACLASGKRRTICVTGDGGFMLNVGELEVVRRLNLPIKFLVYNNQGYNSIRQMQRKRFEGRLVGADAGSGFTMPKLQDIAIMADMDYQEIYSNPGLVKARQSMSYDGPSIIELNMDPEFVQYPRVDSSMGANGVPVPDPMEDMTPHLPDGELAELMRWGND
jgi:acetolactate synthase-1/2/3 large subunit